MIRTLPNGALVHFAVSNSAVMMTTPLVGPKTTFLSFNRGDNGAAGNPPNEKGEHRTAYLWEDIWERDSWLEFLGRYIVAAHDNKEADRPDHFPPLPSARRDTQAAHGSPDRRPRRQVLEPALGRLRQAEVMVIP
jgi:hypothetical protein